MILLLCQLARPRASTLVHALSPPPPVSPVLTSRDRTSTANVPAEFGRFSTFICGVSNVTDFFLRHSHAMVAAAHRRHTHGACRAVGWCTRAVLACLLCGCCAWRVACGVWRDASHSAIVCAAACHVSKAAIESQACLAVCMQCCNTCRLGRGYGRKVRATKYSAVHCQGCA